MHKAGEDSSNVEGIQGCIEDSKAQSCPLFDMTQRPDAAKTAANLDAPCEIHWSRSGIGRWNGDRDTPRKAKARAKAKAPRGVKRDVKRVVRVVGMASMASLPIAPAMAK